MYELYEMGDKESRKNAQVTTIRTTCHSINAHFHWVTCPKIKKGLLRVHVDYVTQLN